MASPKALFSRARENRPFLDHLVRTVQRYQADTGDRLAASVTYFWFLSLFPILLLAISLLGYVYGDEANARVQDALGGVLPPQLVETLGTTLEQAKGPAGVLGVAGTLYSGLAWIDALREAIRTVWHQNVLAGNIVVRKLVDVVVLVGLFATIAASVLTTGLVTGFSTTVLGALGIDDSLPARVFTRVLGYALALVADTALFLYLFARLSRVQNPVRRLLKGAVFGAVGFELLKVLGGIYVARTTSKGEATYGTFAVVVGLLLFLNLVSRLLLLAAAFVVTAPYDSDVAPSGTASKEQARKAGIPEEYADADPDDPPSLQEDGAPTPLQAAIQGKTPAQHAPEGRGSDSAGSDAGSRAGGAAQSQAGTATRPAADPAEDRPRSPSAAAGGLGSPSAGPAGHGLPSPAAVQRTARLTSAALGVVLLGVVAHVLGTLRRVVAGRR